MNMNNFFAISNHIFSFFLVRIGNTCRQNPIRLHSFSFLFSKQAFCENLYKIIKKGIYNVKALNNSYVEFFSINFILGQTSINREMVTRARLIT